MSHLLMPICHLYKGICHVYCLTNYNNNSISTGSPSDKLKSVKLSSRVALSLTSSGHIIYRNMTCRPPLVYWKLWKSRSLKTRSHQIPCRPRQTELYINILYWNRGSSTRLLSRIHLFWIYIKWTAFSESFEIIADWRDLLGLYRPIYSMNGSFQSH